MLEVFTKTIQIFLGKNESEEAKIFIMNYLKENIPGLISHNENTIYLNLINEIEFSEKKINNLRKKIIEKYPELSDTLTIKII